MGTDVSFNFGRVAYADGVRYKWTTNTRKGSYYHKHYKRLAVGGLPIIFQDEAYSKKGDQLGSDYLAVFVAEDSTELVRPALERATTRKL